MGTEVYANGNAVACKKGDGKVIAAFPDVCLSPPSPPAGPIPVPYPDTSFSKDMQSGSTTVKLGGDEAMLKDKSFYKTSPLGDEAATRSFGGNVITHTITGKTYFCAWSMDVKFEGENVPRHLDMTTSNHNPYPGGTGPMSDLEKLALDRIKLGQCPCCGSDTCPAAFQSGDEAISFDDFYKLNETNADLGTKKPSLKDLPSKRALDRQKELAEVEAKQKANCTCKEKTRTKPNPPCDVFRAPDTPRKKRIEAAWDDGPEKPAFQAKHGITDADSAEDKQVNHLTPKSAGGCPTNEGNLQAQKPMCQACRDVDKLQTKWQGR